MVPMTVAVLERGSSAIGNRIGLLVRVDNRCKVYLPESICSLRTGATLMPMSV
jgi:hypothetical protein